MSTELPEPPSKIELKPGVGGGGEVPSFDITLRVRRYLPEATADAYWEDFKLTMYGTDRVLWVDDSLPGTPSHYRDGYPGVLDPGIAWVPQP